MNRKLINIVLGAVMPANFEEAVVVVLIGNAVSSVGACNSCIVHVSPYNNAHVTSYIHICIHLLLKINSA